MKADPAGLDRKDAYALFIGAILPRPIAFVSTVGEDGIFNLAPFSFFTGLSSSPAVVGFGVGRRADGGKKDTLVNIESTKDFVINVVTEDLAEAMNKTAGEYSRNIDEFKIADLTALPSDLVQSPRLAESPVNLECRLMQILEFGEAPQATSFIIGAVVRVHVRDEICVNGVIDISKLRAIGRLGGDLYCRSTEVFQMKRPRGPFA